jgi:serine/threonine protein kinase
MRRLSMVMSQIRDEFTFERTLILTINYLSDLHLKKKMFHGDIKPENIFIENEGDGLITSDSGTLTLLNDPTDKYFIQLYTPGFCSSNHMQSIKNNKG